jgi:hypothetical protein
VPMGVMRKRSALKAMAVAGVAALTLCAGVMVGAGSGVLPVPSQLAGVLPAPAMAVAPAKMQLSYQLSAMPADAAVATTPAPVEQAQTKPAAPAKEVKVAQAETGA